MEYYEVIATINKEQWLEGIPEYQKRTLLDMGLGAENGDDIAQKWLGASTSQTHGFSTEKSSRPFFDNVRKEIIRFLCDDSAYREVKDQVSKIPGGNPALVVSTITAGVSMVLGTSQVLLNPVVALILYGFGKITKTAFCNTFYTPVGIEQHPAVAAFPAENQGKPIA